MFLSSLFCYLKKRLDWKDKVNFKIYDVTAWLTDSYNTNIAQYLTNQRQLENEILMEYNKIIIFLQKSCRK